MLQVKVADAELLTKWQRKNKEYKQRHQLTAHRESDTMARIRKFQEKLAGPSAAEQPVKAAAVAEAVMRPDAEDAAEPAKAQEEVCSKSRCCRMHLQASAQSMYIRKSRMGQCKLPQCGCTWHAALDIGKLICFAFCIRLTCQMNSNVARAVLYHMIVSS